MNRRDPKKRYWLVASVGNLDGTIEFDTEIPQAFDTVEEATEYAKDTAEQGLDSYIYDCAPAYVAKRGKVRVKKLGKS